MFIYFLLCYYVEELSWKVLFKVLKSAVFLKHDFLFMLSLRNYFLKIPYSLPKPSMILLFLSKEF